MRVLVTGGAGFIGSNLVEALVARGDSVTVLDNFSTGAEENLEEVLDDIKVVRGSCQKISSLDLNGFKSIFHIGIPSSSPMYKDDPSLVGKAINGFIEVMELAADDKANVVYASSSSIYAQCSPPHREDMELEPFDYYTEARIAMERLAKVYHGLHNVNSVGMRFFSIYGPHEEFKGRYANIVSQFLWKIKEGKRPKIYGDGEQTRDFTYVGDVVKACLEAADRDLGCERVNVGTGRETSFNRVVELINQILGKSIQPEHVENPIDNYVYRTKADLTKAKKLLDYEPSIDLEEGIKNLIEINYQRK
ncbi:nucleoside-diphosphate sugar epimerase [candidate division MSBL1 archaeon SCGC-AAA261F19]|uniref:Nucleoside-diphosphate sugar epimerase n=2 Tax=candidate division MSBL1 TaxID=215777 RepID=A0A133VB05_9EURY|nr:nucleoside-diphosphate sugar epimerase [candidate division MSBL1 archaeon SCGC-AAA261D19]KXB03636.1 nucleoside-diphosphate sugar epimerase [candidate division MSBL1 archaeon SCGC-AAA261F19]